MAWDTVCNLKGVEGLNIASLGEWNQETMGKLLWNLQNKVDKLWVKWINIYYIKEKDVMTYRIFLISDYIPN